MLPYAIIMLAVAALVALISLLIYRGKTQLVHDYHRQNVKDHVAYGKAFGKAMGILAFAMGLSGIIALFGEKPVVAWTAVAVLLLGLGVGFAMLLRVQKKYNGGIFS